MRCLIGIEEFRVGKHLAQTFAECGFTRGNPSGESDGRHSSEKQKPECLRNSFFLPISHNLSNPPHVAVGRKNPHRNAGAFGPARKPRTDFAHATPTQRAEWHFGLPGKSRGWGGHYGLAVRPRLRVVFVR